VFFLHKNTSFTLGTNPCTNAKRDPRPSGDSKPQGRPPREVCLSVLIVVSFYSLLHYSCIHPAFVCVMAITVRISEFRDLDEIVVTVGFSIASFDHYSFISLLILKVQLFQKNV
jgi:hypothetical protein